MKIALLTLGSQGDVLPYAVLGKALSSHGHEVTLSTAKNFLPLAEKFKLNFVPVSADFQAITESEEGRRMMKNPLQAKKHLKNLIFPMVSESLKTFYSVAKEVDLILFHVKTLADCFADQFPSRMIKANVVPAFEPTNEFPNPVFSGLGYPSFLNKLSFQLSKLGHYMMKDPVRSFRVSQGLPPKFEVVSLLSVYGISEMFLPKPQDFPADSYFPGFWTGSTNDELNPDLQAFIDAGEPPLLITFGSLYFETKFSLTDTIKEIARKLSQRLIVVKGWGINDTSGLEDDDRIFIVSSAPYDKLLPQVQAVIHHGGIGTTAACLYAGKPFLPCPVLYPHGDQFFWSKLSYKHGFALKPVPLKKMTTDIMLKNVEELINNKTLHTNARAFGEKLKTENGLDNTVQIIESFMPGR